MEGKVCEGGQHVPEVDGAGHLTGRHLASSRHLTAEPCSAELGQGRDCK